VKRTVGRTNWTIRPDRTFDLQQHTFEQPSKAPLGNNSTPPAGVPARGVRPAPCWGASCPNFGVFLPPRQQAVRLRRVLPGPPGFLGAVRGLAPVGSEETRGARLAASGSRVDQWPVSPKKPGGPGRGRLAWLAGVPRDGLGVGRSAGGLATALRPASVPVASRRLLRGRIRAAPISVNQGCSRNR
jgi:hypothetical protein